jgi:hypothetical protein
MYLYIFANLLATFISSMPPDEIKKTGIEKLSLEEKKALDKWIKENYLKKSISKNKKQGPVLQENLNNGRLIRLTDNSLWEIRPADTPITQGWITPVEIQVTSTDDPIYLYHLTNTLTGSIVKAKKQSN